MAIPEAAGIHGLSEKRANYFVQITAAIAALAGLLFGLGYRNYLWCTKKSIKHQCSMKS